MEPKRRRGRPNKAEARAKALVALVATGVDPSLIDPRRILASIAVDTSSPAGARVAACRVLLGLVPSDEANPEAAANAAITEKAMQLLARGRMQ